MANDIFNANRFGRYFVSDLKRASTSTGLTFCIVAAMPFILYLLKGIFSLIGSGVWSAPNFAARVLVLIFTTIIVFIALPVHPYGRITEKKYGTSWLMLPASSFEKTLSMLLVCCLIAPAVFFLAYGLLDGILCILDPGCGTPLWHVAKIPSIFNKPDLPQEYASTAKAVTNPLLYADDLIQIPLTFLLGSLVFKKYKIRKTILVLIGLSIITSLIITPFLPEIAKTAASLNDPEKLYDNYKWLFQHIALVDTISDTVVNLALCIAIFFRVKTIKH